MGDEQLRQRALETLMFDPLSTAEKITGKSYTDDTETVAVGLEYLQYNKMRKRAILGELGDTYYGISWHDFLKIISDLGFEIVNSKRSVEELQDGIVVSPTHIIAAHREKKLLIKARSWVPVNPQKNETLSSGTLYGSIDLSGVEEDLIWKFLGHLSFSFYGDKLQFYFGVAEGLMTRLNLIESVAPFCGWPVEEEPTMLYRLLEDTILGLPDWTKVFMGIATEEDKK